MAIKDTWRRALEYFGLVEGDYIEEGEYTDEHDVGPRGETAMMEEPIREPARAGRRAPRRGRDEIDDIFADEPAPRRSAPVTAEEAPMAPPVDTGNGGAGVQMHLVTPTSFNDAQKVADEFKRSRPVILNLQETDADLSKRLIDFASGLTYALSGGMQKIADRTFLLTPRNVAVSAEEAERMLERGFFNQS